MIRQYEATRRTDTSVTISVNPDEYVNGEEFEMAVSIHSSIGVKCLLQDRPLFCHAGNAHGQPRNAMEFLDNASAIEPDREDNPNLAEGTLKHSPDASFYFFTVGSLKDIEQIKRMTLALPDRPAAWYCRPAPAPIAASEDSPTSHWPPSATSMISR